MDEFEAFLAHLFGGGRVVFRGPPGSAAGPSPTALVRLQRAFEAYRLDVAGPLLPFEPAVAAEAAALLRLACWATVSRADRVDDLAPRLTWRRSPGGPSDHLSADLLLRYLPRVYRRVKAVDTTDPVVALLADVLRRWPLSGVLAGLDDPPLTPPGFGGHPGLMLLYAERFAAGGRPAWRPVGPGEEVLELVEGIAAPRRPAALGLAARRDRDD